MNKLLLGASGLALAALSIEPVHAQSNCSYIAYNAILTAGQWNLCFSGKQDALGFTPAPSTSALPVYTANGTQVSLPHAVSGVVVLGNGTANVSFSGLALFTGNTAYSCQATDQTGNASVFMTPSAGNLATVGGSGNHTIAYFCIGD